MPRAFLGTNILLYAAGINPSEARKRQAAEDLIAPMDWHSSVQVIQEFFVNATRARAAAALSDEAALAFIALWRQRPIQDITLTLFADAIDIRRRYRLSYWDGAIVAAAKAQGCDLLYSEDLQDGQAVDGVRIRNPF